MAKMDQITFHGEPSKNAMQLLNSEWIAKHYDLLKILNNTQTS